MSNSTYQKSKNQRIDLNEEQKVYVRTMINFLENRKLKRTEELIKKYRAKKQRAFNTFLKASGAKMLKNMELDTEYMYIVEGLNALKLETQHKIYAYKSEIFFGAEQYIIDHYNEVITEKKANGDWDKVLEEASEVSV